MKSEAHREYNDTAVRETVLDEFKVIYMAAIGGGRADADRFVGQVWDDAR